MDGIPVLPGVLRVMVPDAVVAGIIKQPLLIIRAGFIDPRAIIQRMVANDTKVHVIQIEACLPQGFMGKPGQFGKIRGLKKG